MNDIDVVVTVKSAVIDRYRSPNLVVGRPVLAGNREALASDLREVLSRIAALGNVDSSHELTSRIEDGILTLQEALAMPDPAEALVFAQTLLAPSQLSGGDEELFLEFSSIQRDILRQLQRQNMANNIDFICSDLLSPSPSSNRHPGVVNTTASPVRILLESSDRVATPSVDDDLYDAEQFLEAVYRLRRGSREHRE